MGTVRVAVPAAIVAAVALLVLPAASAFAQLPVTMNYQVMLTDDSDEPLADQTVTLFFVMYDAAEGGTLNWSELHAGVTTNSIGVASVTLGETSPLVPEHFEGPRWLEVAVNGQTLSPRRELNSSPYAMQAGDSGMLAGLAPEEYTLDDDLSNTGVINTPSNPVDWTMLKNVPSGFADGTDNTGGAGDGHSLDAVDGDPIDAVYVDAEGRVGIGAVSPYHQLVVGPAPSGLSYAQFANPTTLYGQNDGFAVGIDGTGSAFISQNEDASIWFVTDGLQRHTITADGDFEFGSPTTDGAAEFYAAGAANPQVVVWTDPGYGGHVGLYEEGGDQYMWMEPDYDGTGGYFQVLDGTHSPAFTVDGYGQFSGEARVSITGLYSETYFNTGYTYDDAVQLPNSAVAADEIFDEAGGTTARTTLAAPLDGSIQSIAFESIYCPDDGLVLAIGTVKTQVADNGATGLAHFAVSDAAGSIPSGGECTVRIPNTGSSGVWLTSPTVHGLFPVTAGTRTFYLLAQEVEGAWAIFDRTLTLVYLPTSYGVASSTEAPFLQDDESPLVGASTSLTEGDIAAERAETEAFNAARVRQELADMEARISEIRTSLADGNRP